MKQPIKQLKLHKNQQSKKPTALLSGKGKLRDYGGGSHSEKREWEVGKKEFNNEIDDMHSIKL